MNIVLFGPPGAGKGTQAKKISEKFNLIDLSSGQLMREEIASNSRLGIAVKEIVTAGDLVPDHLANEIVKGRIDANDDKEFLFDGFPRTINQAEALNKWLKERGQELSFAVNLKVDDEALVKRMLDRHRLDDSEETIRHRLDVYEKQTSPLIDFYRKQGVLVEIDGMGTIDEVYNDIIEKLS